jgi:uncharacterized protein (TIGR02996 family)
MLPAPFRAMDPADDLAWLAVADWLEEHDQPDRAELVRLTRLLRLEGTGPDRPRREDRLRELLAAGVEPCVATLKNSIGMELAYIPAGTFLMGSPEDEEDRSEDEGPVHAVKIAKAFYLGVYAVTQGEYEAVMRKNPSWFSATGDGKPEVEGLKTSRFPVEMVSHDGAVKFCEKLSALEGEKENERVYRLPTEAEWEYACRGGAGSAPFHFGQSLSSEQANIDGNYPHGDAAKGPFLERTCEVGSYKPNGYGLYDMHGNVWEWCSDWYGEYSKGDKVNPPGPSEGSKRVIRGGGWSNAAVNCSASFRGSSAPANRGLNLGLRLLLSSATE